jgi:acyl dehydratase
MTTFFDSIEIGMKQELGSYTFQADEIIEFATDFDPQPFHLSQEDAEKSNFGSLCASGWHTLSVWMKLNITNGRSEFSRLVGRDCPETVFGPSPGVRNIKWLWPVYAGETIRYTSEITGKRKNPKRPGWGMVLSHSQGFNEAGKCVMQMDGAVTVRTDV